jgi:hypothetical protein
MAMDLILYQLSLMKTQRKKVGKLKKVLTSGERYDNISNVAEKSKRKIKNKKTLDK